VNAARPIDIHLEIVWPSHWLNPSAGSFADRCGLIMGRLFFGLVLLVVAGCAKPIVVDPATVGTPGSGTAHELYQPAGSGTHPAAVVLHGCAGITPSVRHWAARLAEWGYVALVLDSFGPRGIQNVCDRPDRVSARLRAEDAFAAAAYLRGRTDVLAEHVSVVGFSQGGDTALVAASRSAVKRTGAAPFAAIVAFYPWCPLGGDPIASPVLILIGDADDWTPAERCKLFQSTWRPEFGSASLQVYPGATHAFDALGPDRRYLGHLLRYDAGAAEDAAARMRRFLEGPSK
jgi:dienelactone hydrolase